METVAKEYGHEILHLPPPLPLPKCNLFILKPVFCNFQNFHENSKYKLL